MSGLQKMVDAIKGSAILIVELKMETRHHRKGDIFLAEVMVDLPGKNLVAKAHGENLILAISMVKKELKRELSKYKTKMIESPRRKIQKASREIL